MKNETCISEKLCKQLCQKITTEYIITDHKPDTSTVFETIKRAYNKASELFCLDSDSSIISSTFDFYIEHMDKAIDMFIDGLDDYKAVSKLLWAYSNVYRFLNSETDVFKTRLKNELEKNKDYYRLFTIDYYIELAESEGISTALQELEKDINIRLFTYYNAAYHEYMDLLPGLSELIESLKDEEE